MHPARADAASAEGARIERMLEAGDFASEIQCGLGPKELKGVEFDAG